MVRSGRSWVATHTTSSGCEAEARIHLRSAEEIGLISVRGAVRTTLESHEPAGRSEHRDGASASRWISGEEQEACFERSGVLFELD